MNFVRQYWVWILIPCLLVVLGIILLVVLGGKASNDFIYEL